LRICPHPLFRLWGGAPRDVFLSHPGILSLLLFFKYNRRLLYAEYPDGGHNVFMWVYTEPALVEWLFSQYR